MSCIHIAACQLASSPYAFTIQSSQLSRASICPSIYLGTKFPKVSLKSTSAKSQHQRAPVVCLLGGKGKSENGNEGSPWKTLQNAMGQFKKDQSIEDVLRQQIQKQDYYDDDDGGSGGKRPGGGGGDGFGEAEDGLSGIWDEFTQVILATVGFLFLYVYIIEGEEINVLAKDLFRFLFKRQMSIRLRRLVDQWKSFFQRMKQKEEFDPYWLEHEIINTPTWYDRPAKYRYIIKALNSRADDDE